MRSKVNFGHRRQPLCPNFKKKKVLFDLRWPEMRSKVNFGHPKWPTAAILSKISKKAIESEFYHVRNSLSIAFLAISDRYATLCIYIFF